MSELTASKKAIQLDKNSPHLNNHEIVIELSAIEDAIAQNAETIIRLSKLIDAQSNGAIGGLTAQVNYLQDKVKELEAKCTIFAPALDVASSDNNSLIPQEEASA